MKPFCTFIVKDVSLLYYFNNQFVRRGLHFVICKTLIVLVLFFNKKMEIISGISVGLM